MKKLRKRLRIRQSVGDLCTFLKKVPKTWELFDSFLKPLIDPCGYKVIVLFKGNVRKGLKGFASPRCGGKALLYIE